MKNKHPKLFPAAVFSRLLYGFLLISTGAVFPQERAGKALATIGAEAVYEEELNTAAAAQLQNLRKQEYEIRRKALDDLIAQKLLDREAKRRGLTPDELLREEVDAKIGEPTEGEVQAYYLAQQNFRLRPLKEVAAQVRQSLKHARTLAAREEYKANLSRQPEVAILLRPPKVNVGYDPARFKGSPGAPVRIVEFTDYQCPFCRNTQSVLNKLQEKYGDRLSRAVRDFPLRQIHPQAEQAASAARCAAEQGKFWEYHQILFQMPAPLDEAALLQQAVSIGLDREPFQACLASGKYRASIEKDFQEGMSHGVTGTPAFFINGVPLSGAQPIADFENIIDAELAAAERAQ